MGRQLVVAPIQRSRLKPLSAESFALQFTIGRTTHEKLKYVQALMSHRLPSGDIGQVFDRELDALKGQLEKQKFAATTKPRPRGRRTSSSANPCHIPAQVKRAVWERDEGQCSFVGEGGRRCRSRKLLEFDHLDPVARGGQATVANVRLRCARRPVVSGPAWRRGSDELAVRSATRFRHTISRRPGNSDSRGSPEIRYR